MKSQAMTLSIHVPEEVLYGDQARKVLAQAAELLPEHQSVPAEIFHYSANSQHPKTGTSPFRFGGGRGRFLIHAIGEEAVDELSACGHLITKALGRHYGGPLKETRQVKDVFLDVSSRLETFRVPFMVIQGNAREFELLTPAAKEGLVTPEVLSLVEKKIRRGIDKQYSLYGAELNEDDYILGDVEIQGNKGGKFVPVSVGNGVYWLAAKEVRFTTNLQLAGPWHVGHLISRGYGRIAHIRDEVVS